jgi:hypothetical protein
MHSFGALEAVLAVKGYEGYETKHQWFITRGEGLAVQYGPSLSFSLFVQSYEFQHYRE